MDSSQLREWEPVGGRVLESSLAAAAKHPPISAARTGAFTRGELMFICRVYLGRAAQYPQNHLPVLSRYGGGKLFHLHPVPISAIFLRDFCD